MPRRFRSFAALLAVATGISLAPVTAAPSASAPLPMPAGLPVTIEVGRTYRATCVRPGRGIRVQRMRFVDYVRNVLPNEWGLSFPAASLDAGAIAAKQFALAAILDGKWRRQGYPFDVVDSTCDQVFRDGSAHPSTNAAIARTWALLVKRNGGLPRLYYRAYDRQCAGVPDCMGQVESANLARRGWNAERILQRYYGGPGFALVPLRPPAEEAPAPPEEPPPPTGPVMPALVGLGENQAKERLAAMGVTRVTVDYQERDQLGELFDRAPAYSVVSHLPPIDAAVGPDTVVVLGVRAP